MQVVEPGRRAGRVRDAEVGVEMRAEEARAVGGHHVAPAVVAQLVAGVPAEADGGVPREAREQRVEVLLALGVLERDRDAESLRLVRDAREAADAVLRGRGRDEADPRVRDDERRADVGGDAEAVDQLRDGRLALRVVRPPEVGGLAPRRVDGLHREPSRRAAPGGEAQVDLGPPHGEPAVPARLGDRLDEVLRRAPFPGDAEAEGALGARRSIVRWCAHRGRDSRGNGPARQASRRARFSRLSRRTRGGSTRRRRRRSRGRGSPPGRGSPRASR